MIQNVTALIYAAVSALVGLLVGFLFRSAAARGDKERNQQSAVEMATLRSQVQSLQNESVVRAGFEALASERERTIQRLTAERDGLLESLHAKGVIEQQYVGQISRLEAELEGERQSLKAKVELLEGAKQSLTHQFEALAGKILEDKSAKFTEQNKLNLDQLLNPLRLQINDFRGKVEEAQKDSNAGRVEFRTKLEALEKLNQQLSTEAHALSTALRGSSKTQGDWGEFILRDLLEKAGLREGEQYRFQESFSGAVDEDGLRGKAARTDVILNLPGGRHLVIDSKVSLNAYSDHCNATTEDQRKAALKVHVLSVRNHYEGLSKRNYHKLNGLDSPDFVVMFIPIEPAFHVTMQEAGDLWREAYERNVLLVGPTTLLFVIRIIDNLWQQERQVRSVQDIVKRGTALYEKFVGFVADLEHLGDSLRKASKSYDDSMSKLTSGRENLIGQAEKLKKMGIRTSKQLPTKLLDAAGIDEEERAELSLAASGLDE